MSYRNSDSVKQLQYEWERYERDIKFAIQTIEQWNYDPLAFFETKCDPTRARTLSEFRAARFAWAPVYLMPNAIELVDDRRILNVVPVPDLSSVMPKRQQPPLEPPSVPDWYRSPGVGGKTLLDHHHHKCARILEQAASLRNLINDSKDKFSKLHSVALDICNRIPSFDFVNEVATAELILTLTHKRNYYDANAVRDVNFQIDQTKRLLFIQCEISDLTNAEVVFDRHDPARPIWKEKLKPRRASASDRRKIIKEFIYSNAIRLGVLSAKSPSSALYDAVCINVATSWRDPATGQPRKGVIASVEAPTAFLEGIDTTSVDPTACYRAMKGIITPSVEEPGPIRPIFEMSRDDPRHVERRNMLADDADIVDNIAAMGWEDFEHLVAELFEREFAGNGVEVKVTRASRDSGVDAVLYDPDPFRGGKYVIQAKRYTNTVDVAAVRDLYGTILNEGANRGILITTSGFGSDSYEFAKDKPISLIDGPQLLMLLKKHGRTARIDLAEAKRVLAQMM